MGFDTRLAHVLDSVPAVVEASESVASEAVVFCDLMNGTEAILLANDLTAISVMWQRYVFTVTLEHLAGLLDELSNMDLTQPSNRETIIVNGVRGFLD